MALDDFSAADKLRLKIEGQVDIGNIANLSNHAVKAGIAELAKGSNLLSFSTRVEEYIMELAKAIALSSSVLCVT